MTKNIRKFKRILSNLLRESIFVTIEKMKNIFEISNQKEQDYMRNTISEISKRIKDLDHAFD